MFGWFKKKPVENVRKNPKISFEVQDKAIIISVECDSPYSEEETINLVESLSNIIFYNQTGQLNNTIIEALINRFQKENRQDIIAAVQTMVNLKLDSIRNYCMKPSQVFMQRNNNVG